MAKPSASAVTGSDTANVVCGTAVHHEGLRVPLVAMACSRWPPSWSSVSLKLDAFSISPSVNLADSEERREPIGDVAAQPVH